VSSPAVLAYSHDLLPYLWHYLIARLLYDEVVRRLARGDGTSLVVAIVAVGLVLATLFRARARRRGLQ
jgi:hypothetical protein